MKSMQYIATLALVLAISSNSAAVPVLSSIERQVVAASQTRVAAFNRRDAAAIERSTAEDFVTTTDAGNVVHGRTNIVALVRKSATADEQWESLRGYQTQTIRNVVVVTFAYDVREQYGPTSIVASMAATEV